MTANTCLDFLTEYLCAVRQELSHRRIVVHTAAVHAPMPQQALGLSMELSLAGGALETRAGAQSMPMPVPVPAQVPVPRERLRAGWHEELGWWAEPVGCPGTGRRWFAAELVPSPDRVATYLAGLTRHENLGTTVPALHRYRLLAAPDDLLPLLARQAVGSGPVADKVTASPAM